MVLTEMLKEPLPRLLVQVGVIVLASRLLGRVARRLGQPMVIAEITAGILLGPSLLGALAPQTYAAIFPAQSLSVLSLVSQLGLVLFMFLIGLEFDPKLLRGRAHSSIAISHSSIIVPFGMGALLAVSLRGDLAGPSATPLAFGLFMGAAMSITAFPVLARILSEQRLVQTRMGGLALTCAAVDDVTAWCLLAFVVAITRSHGLGSALGTTALTFVYIAAMVWLVRPLLARLSARANRPEALSQNIVAAVILLLLLSSLITELIGIHALFGAFLFGVILPKGGSFGTMLASKLEGVVLIVLLPLFFAYSGVRTQLGLLDSASAWLTCGVIILVACSGKFGASTLAARLTGLPWRESTGLGVLMNTRGLMELIVLNIGLDLGVIGPKLFTMMVIMALFTTFMTTPLLRWIYPPESTTRALTHAAMPASLVPRPPGFCLVICVADERVGGSLAVLARALCHGQDERVYALSLTPPTERGVFSELEAPSPLPPLLARASELSLTVQPLSFVSAAPAEDICAVAEDRGANLLLLGSHKPVVGKSLLGGAVRAVMRNAPSDTGVLIDHGLTQVRRVLLPFLGTVHDLSALALARRMLEGPGLQLTLLELREANLTSPPPDPLQGMRAWLGSRTGVEHRQLTTESPFEAVLAELANGYDLLLVGASRDLGLVPRPFGLQRERLLSECPISVLVVRQAAEAREAAASRPTPVEHPLSPRS